VLDRRLVAAPDLKSDPRPSRRTGLLDAESFVALYCVPLLAKGQVVGVLEVFHRTPLNPDGEWLNFLETLAGQAAIAVADHWLFTDLQRSNMDMLVAYDTTLEGWSAALDLRDKETEGHSQRVSGTTLQLARALGVNDSDLEHIRRGALLHDIGKMGIPDSILLKPDKLTDDEWKIMRQHPGYAHELLAPIAFLRQALEIPYCHHEKWDGTGYPRQLKGESIPLSARIFAVVDVWDALRSDRPYRQGWPEANVLDYIRDQAGEHFDPRVVEAFLALRAQRLAPVDKLRIDAV
jgi:putative nucleotidyltransferase with HDIG domain